jgi:hypothetical protein
MINATELRIGNWVTYHGENDMPCQIDGQDILNIEYCGSGYNEIHSPIPLTPEILERCGWIWNEECNSFEKYPNGDARMNLQKVDVNSSYTMFNYVLKAVIVKRIHFLHQLQNIYYSLTGEELKVEL